jgi:hypothetical protein
MTALHVSVEEFVNSSVFDIWVQFIGINIIRSWLKVLVALHQQGVRECKKQLIWERHLFNLLQYFRLWYVCLVKAVTNFLLPQLHNLIHAFNVGFWTNQQLLVESARIIHCFDCECANVFFRIVYTCSLDKLW